MTVEGLSPAQETAARLALQQVCDMTASAEFARRVEAREWSPACPSFFFSRQRRIEAAALLSALRSETPAFTLKLGTFRNRKVTAETSVSERRITLVASRLDRVISDEMPARIDAGADLINTLGHELTHLIPEPGNSAAFRFRDRGQSMPWCKRDLLVSYGLGQIYEDLWRESVTRVQ
jgi:hypothetical protein